MDATLLKPGPWWATGELDPLRHRSFVMRIELFAEAAGLTDRMETLWEPLPAAFPEAAKTWADKVAEKKPMGSIILKGDPGAVRDMSARLVGYLLRNFTDARLRTFSEVVTRLQAGEVIGHRVVALPDFSLAGMTAAEPAFRRTQMAAYVLERLMRKQPTILGVDGLRSSDFAYNETLLKSLNTRAFVVPA